MQSCCGGEYCLSPFFNNIKVHEFRLLGCTSAYLCLIANTQDVELPLAMTAPILEPGNVCVPRTEFRRTMACWMGSGSHKFATQSTLVLELIFEQSTSWWVEMNYLAAACTELARAVHSSRHMHICWLHYEANYREGLRVIQEEEKFEEWYKHFVGEYEGDMPLALSDND